VIRRRRLTGYDLHLRQVAAAQRFSRRNARLVERKANDEARGFERTIPASGPGRRRAKALRNKRAVLGPDA
jgi:hypothetical protein